MRAINLDRDWQYQSGTYFFLSDLGGRSQAKTVSLPHDYMLESQVTPDAPAGSAMGYYNGTVGSYTKKLQIPKDWKDEKIFLHFDGVMMNAAVEVNGSQVCLHHYGYTPFWADITPSLNFGEENRITVTVNPSMQPNSRWYSGAGIFRHVELVHTPLVHIAADGIYAFTSRIEMENGEAKEAYVSTQITVANETLRDHLVKVTAALIKEDTGKQVLSRSAVIQVCAGNTATARIPMTVIDPVLWDAEHPELYCLWACAADLGEFGSCPATADDEPITDEIQVLFGIRTVTADASHGLKVNGKPVKLKGGCIHHDNGILGAVSLYDSEYRKLRLLKESGFNTVRMAHNPPSACLLEACDRLGMYVVDEAFDAWGMAKQPGDYSQFFKDHWKEDMKAFILRDRCHPSILLWSTGNEIVERGGLGNGYGLALELAEYVRSLDASRLVTNGLCSFWSGLDDKTVIRNMENLEKIYGAAQAGEQNAAAPAADTYWEERSEPFVSMLDVVGYNYCDDHYEIDHTLYPERVILGTESYPMDFDKLWNLTEKLPYVIGDCTWTCFDYIGEAGIGRSLFVEPDDPALKMGPYYLHSQNAQFPWRLANDADYDINGNLTPQGAYRRIVWGSQDTFLYTVDPKYHDKAEIVSKWGWPMLTESWNWNGFEGRPVQITVYSSAQETELFLNAQSLGRQPAGSAHRNTAVFTVPYQPGLLTAVSYVDGKEVSRCSLKTTGKPAAIRLLPESVPGKEVLTLAANGENLLYVPVEIVDENALRVPDAAVLLKADVIGAASLAGFGSANPITTENYTAGSFTSYKGQALAIVRSGYEPGEATLTVTAEGLESVSLKICVK